MTKRPLSKHEFEQTIGAHRPPVVAPRGRSRLRERPGGVAARRRSGPVFVSPSDENASDFSTSLWSERLDGVAPGSRSQRSARAMIIFAPLSSSKYTQMSQRTPCGTPIPDKDSLNNRRAATSSSRSREVAPGFGSDLEGSLRDVAPGPFLCLRAMKTRATSPRRSGKKRERPRGVTLAKSLRASGATWSDRSIGHSGSVFGFHRDEMASDFSASLCRSGLRERPGVVALIGRSGSERLDGVAPGSRSQRSARPMIIFTPLSSSKYTQMSPRTPCGTPIPDKDS
ncbi:hypothetical protein DY000_02050630 [Brassica cretica]|uniref:DUF4005 domain-containing protein n=1 Tax=Brassica cretica TaxID=69181 RepID=A0ABQ7F247_BRACR|nr:hypothetical protein DY000_02050630 [Brassica cretica]